MSLETRSSDLVRAVALAAALAGSAVPAGAQTAAQKNPEALASQRAVERCTALAKQENIRLGKLEKVERVGFGVYDVRWARPFFGKPQLCRYEGLRDRATFAGSGGTAALPAPVPVDDKKTREEAMGYCRQLLLSMGKGSPIPMEIVPQPGGFLELTFQIGASGDSLPEKCRYDVNAKKAEYIR